MSQLPPTVLISSYNGPTRKGIYAYSFSPTTSAPIEIAQLDLENPSFFFQVPDSPTIYAVSEANNVEEALVYSLNFEYGIKPKFTIQNQYPTLGADPCYITAMGNAIITANYSSGSLSVLNKNKTFPFNINFESKIGHDINRQECPHLHCVHITPDQQHLIAADLGSDNLYLYSIFPELEDQSQMLKLKQTIELPPGSGPRHITFSKDGNFLYLLNELSGTLMTFTYSINPSSNSCSIVPIQTIQADQSNGRGSADIHLSPDQQFLYTSHRLVNDGISVFKRDIQTGQLEFIQYVKTGSHPRNFAISSDNLYMLVACRDDNVVQVFQRNLETGGLTLLEDQGIQVEKPVCVQFRI